MKAREGEGEGEGEEGVGEGEGENGGVVVGVVEKVQDETSEQNESKLEGKVEEQGWATPPRSPRFAPSPTTTNSLATQTSSPFSPSLTPKSPSTTPSSSRPSVRQPLRNLTRIPLPLPLPPSFVKSPPLKRSRSDDALQVKVREWKEEREGFWWILNARGT